MRVPSVVRGSLLVALLLACSSERALGPGSELPKSAPVFDLNNTTGPFLVITEVMPNPAATNDVGEYVEIFNAGTAAVNLQGMSLRSANGTGGQITSINISASVPVAPRACVILSTHATVAGVTVAFAYGTNGSMMFTNGSLIDYMELVSGGEIVDRVQVTVNPGNHNGFAFYLDVPSTTDITTIDNATVTGTGSTINAPWKRAVATDQAFGAGNLERGTPGTCNYGGRQDEEDEITSVSVTGATIAVGGTATLTATATGGSGTITYDWSSDNTSFVQVDPATGVVTGVAIGSANITAMAPNGVSGSGVVNVVDVNAVAKITVGVSNTPPFTIGYTRKAFATVENAFGTRIFPELTWSTVDGSIATVDSRGYVTARGVPAGLSNVTTSVIVTAGGVTGSAPVIVQTPLFLPSVIYRDHTDFGDPVDANPADDIILRKRQFDLSYNATRGGPNWVSWNMNSTQTGSRPRCDCFTADVELLSHGLTEAQLIEDADYANAEGDYDRGHMVQSASRDRTDAENASTYLMTNILPQAKDNNQGPWQDFEEFTNDFAEAGKEVYVMAGGIYGPSPMTLKSDGRVQIPEYTWKVVVVVNGAAGVADVDYFDDLQVFAVKMPNIDGVAQLRRTGEPVDYWKKYLVTVDEIEALTGYDVLSNLPDDIENPVEAGDRPPVATMKNIESPKVEGSSIILDGSGSSDPDGDALTYTWTVSNGTISSTLHGASASHTFTDNGSYTVTLTVRDPLGAWNTKTSTVQVTNAAPIASFTVDATSVTSGDVVQFAGSFTDAGTGDDWSWTINWGDGSSVSGSASEVPATVARNHTYNAAGTHTITFTVRDDDGDISTSSMSVQVARRLITISVAPEAINDNDIGNARIKVEALSGNGFDATLVNLATACIGEVCVDERGNSGNVFANLIDVDGDGDLDLVMRFARRELVRARLLSPSTNEVVFHADLMNGEQVEGIGSVVVH